MKEIRWFLHTGFEKATHEGVFEVEDDATENEIEEMARDEAFNNIDWGWNYVNKKGDEQE